MAGEIANPLMFDTESTIPPTVYAPLPIGGFLTPLEGDVEGNRAILTTNGTGMKTLPDGSPNPAVQPLQVMAQESVFPTAPGVAPPPTPPSPASISRPELVAVQNTRVFFADAAKGPGQYIRVAVTGDAMSTEPPTLPPLRPITTVAPPPILTVPTLYPTIIIGSRSI